MTTRDRSVLGVLAVVAVIAGFYLLIVKPTSADVADLDTQITAAESRRDVALADLQTAAAAREQYKRDQATLAVLGKAVPADEGVPSLLYQLHKAARKSGVDFDSVTVSENADAASSTADGGLTKLPLTIKFDGTFFKLDRFLRSLHGFAEIGEEKVDVRGRLLTIDAVNLAPQDENGSTLTAEITATAYVAPTEAGKAAATTAAGASTASGTDTAGTTGTTSANATPTPSTGAAE